MSTYIPHASRPSVRRPWLALTLAGLAVAAPVVPAQEAEEGPSFSLSAAYTGDLRRNTTGGVATGTAYSDAVDLGLVWVTEAFGPRMTTNVSVMYLGGDDISSEYVGDLQYVNNIEASNGWKLYESWVEFSFGESSNTLRAGVLDLNAEFDTPVTQGLFVSSPFGIGTDLSQTGLRGPVCWPNTGLGVRAAGSLTDSVQWRLGAYDGAPGSDRDGFTSTRLSSDEGALVAGEIEYASERIHKLAFGAWAYSAAFDRVDSTLLPAPRAEHGNRGFYAHLDGRLGALGDVDVDGAVRAGVAAARFNAVDRYVGVAVSASKLFDSRPGDALGVGVAWAHLGDEYRALRSFEGLPATAAETTFELVYRAELTPWLSVLPNVQFVKDPGADRAVNDSWVAGFRFEIARDKTWPLQARRDAGSDESYARTER